MSDAEQEDCTQSTQDDQIDEIEEKLFAVERAKTGRAKCKKCKNTIDTGALRLAKMVTNPFGTGKMKVWHHLPCLFEVFKKQRATTPKIEKIDDVAEYEYLSPEDIEEILKYLSDDARAHWETISHTLIGSIPVETSKKKKTMSKKGKSADTTSEKDKTSFATVSLSYSSDPNHRDNTLRQFRKICVMISNESSYLQKTNVLKTFFEKGSDGNSFKGNLLSWCRLLLPGTVDTVYNLQSKQLVKIFSRIFQTDQEEMLRHLDEGDVALTVSEYFTNTENVQPASKSTLTMQDVEQFLQKLSTLTHEDEQQQHLANLTKKCTVNDLQIIIRFIKHDLRINAGPKHILDALHPDAHELYKTCRDIDNVIKNVIEMSTDQEALNINIKILTPVQPMLAEACKSLESVLSKYPNGLLAETKYDGERVQLHKRGSEFKYFSRSLKPVSPHKVNHFKDYIEKAFPSGDDLILDCEVLMIDMKTGNPLPFGTLGKHKKNEFQNANPCLFIFDCLYYNGKTLLTCTLKERREILRKNMIEIPNHIQFSAIKRINNFNDLAEMLTHVLDAGLEGLVLKDPSGVYEPGKRRWIKVKRDYLFEGKAADSVDLVVLGAWYGTGNKGGMMSVFLMGCYNPIDQMWRSVTKVHGHDDETLKALQTELDMIKIRKDPQKVPKWLEVTRTMIPDFVARDPKKMPIWEICGHEFTQHDVHTAHGISIRFPRVARVRDDKTWETATSLSELKDIYEKSKTNPSSRLLPFLNLTSNTESQSKTSPNKNAEPKQKIISANDEFAEETRKRKILPDQPLPNVLAGKRIKIEDTAADLEFQRHFIAYGAAVVDTETNATHKIVPGSFSLITNSMGEKMMKIQLEKLENK